MVHIDAYHILVFIILSMYNNYSILVEFAECSLTNNPLNIYSITFIHY